jgi:hypothetical protein
VRNFCGFTPLTLTYGPCYDLDGACHYQLEIILSPVEGRFRAVLAALGPQKPLFDGLRVTFAAVEKVKICFVKVH